MDTERDAAFRKYRRELRAMIAEFGVVNGSQFFIAGLSLVKAKRVREIAAVLKERGQIKDGFHIRDQRSD